MLDVASLCKRYGSQPALVDVSLSIERGEILGLVGANGAGKSTFVSLVAGLLKPDSGRIRVDGIDAVRERHRVAPLLGVAPQETGVYPLLSVRENLAFFGKLAGVRGKALRGRIGEIAEAFSVAALLDRRVGTLSGGQQRRLHAATALMGRPGLILLDEPTAGVDVGTRHALLEVIKKLADDGAAFCYTTHYLHEIETLGCTVGIIDRGHIISRGPLPDLLRAHGESVAVIVFKDEPPRLDGTMPSLAMERSGRTLRLRAPDPTAAVKELLSNLTPSATAGVEAIEILHPSLETVFLSLTGRRYAETAAAADADAGGDAR